MYLVAQKVRKAQIQEGTNCFLYLHGQHIWKGWPPFTPEQNPGKLMCKVVEVSEGNNAVRSYLDILTPDVTSPTSIRASFEQLLLRFPSSIMPQGVVVGPCWFRFNLDFGLSLHINREIRTLFEYNIALRIEAFGE
jgi:hypothetical protein